MEAIIGIGAKVVLQDSAGWIEELELVRLANAKELDLEHGQISVDSPVGRALIGRKTGEEITVRTPMGEMRYRILAVKPTLKWRHQLPEPTPQGGEKEKNPAGLPAENKDGKRDDQGGDLAKARVRRRLHKPPGLPHKALLLDRIRSKR